MHRYLELGIDVVFIFSVVANFFIGYLTEELEVCTEHRDVMRHYLSTWFLADLIGSLPLNWLFAATWRQLRDANATCNCPFRYHALAELVKCLARLPRLGKPPRSRVRAHTSCALPDRCLILSEVWQLVASSIHPCACPAKAKGLSLPRP